MAEKNFGVEYAQQMRNEYANLGENEQQAWVSSNAVRFVQNQAPCSNMSKKAKWWWNLHFQLSFWLLIEFIWFWFFTIKKKAPRKINCLKVKIYELKGSNKKLKVKKYYYQIGLILLRSLRSIFSLTMLSLLERIFSLYDFLLDFSLMDFI